MRFALVNPAWSFEGSIYFGCREPHLPLEYGYTRALLAAEGHEAMIVDAQAEGLDVMTLRARVDAIKPDVVVVTTAPSYLFWRCPPPELRVPKATIDILAGAAPSIVVVGPHASTTPGATLAKLGADLAVMGECEEVIATLARTPPSAWKDIASTAARDAGGRVRQVGGPHAADMNALPALQWSREELARHAHHHHRFDATPLAPGAEMEASRGCPYHCTFCAKDNYRDRYRKRPLATVLAELDGLKASGVEYVYFIDEIFLPDEPLLREIAQRDIRFGIQTRIDLWSFELLDLLGQAGCRSIEAGVESISTRGRAQLAKRCRLSTDEITERLLRARRSVPFVQATLMESNADDPAEVERWRRSLFDHGVWANEPVPLFPYPGSPDYTRLWGIPDENAWERAHEHYLRSFDRFSDIQDQGPVRLPVLEGQNI
jgi:B12-binding domain/radical SAM domain protein of rhizo-twelve system